MKLANFSNWGATAAAIAAPGQGILSTVPGASSGGKDGGSYAVHDGTSQAAAQVAGAAALLLAARRQAGYTRARAADIRDDLLLSARKVEALKGRCSTGGVLDVAAAMARIPREGPRDPKESAWLRQVAEATAAGTEGKVASTMPLSAAAAAPSSSAPLSREDAAAAAAAADAESRRRDALAATAAAAGGRLPTTAHTAADAAALAAASAAGGAGAAGALPVAVAKGGKGAAPVALPPAVSPTPKTTTPPAPAPSPPTSLPSASSSFSSSSSSNSRVSSFPEVVPGDRSTLAEAGTLARPRAPAVASASVVEASPASALSSRKTAPLASSSAALPSLLPPPLFG